MQCRPIEALGQFKIVEFVVDARDQALTLADRILIADLFGDSQRLGMAVERQVQLSTPPSQQRDGIDAVDVSESIVAALAQIERTQMRAHRLLVVTESAPIIPPQSECAAMPDRQAALFGKRLQ